MSHVTRTEWADSTGVSWLIHACVTRLIDIGYTYEHVLYTHISMTHAHIRNELIPQVWHSLSMQVNHNSLKWIHLCCDTWVQVRHDSLYACAMTLSMRVPWLILCEVAWISLCVCHDLLYAKWHDVWHVDARVRSLSSNLWHDSFICVTWLIPYECCGSFM